MLEIDSKMDKETTLKIVELLNECLDKHSRKRHNHFIQEIKETTLKYINLIEIHDRAIVYDLNQELIKIKAGIKVE